MSGGARPALKLLVTGLAIVLAVLLVALGVVIQVFVVHFYHITGGAIFTTAPLGRTLTIVHSSSVVVAMSAPIAIGVGAYWLAGRWLAASRNDAGVNRPTPYQLGVLMKTLHGANLEALWESSTYVVGGSSAPGGRALPRPPMLGYAVLMLLAFLSLAYGSAGAELWLGAVSEAVLYPVTTPLQTSGTLPALGREVNQTMCDQWASSIQNKPYQCGLNQGSGPNFAALSAQLLTMNGVSASNVVAFTDDASAIMVPPATNLSESLEYVATTYGVKSTCSSVTAQCIDMGNLGPQAGLALNCSSSVAFNTTSRISGCNRFNTAGVESSFGGPLSANGTLLPCSQNPDSVDFRVGVVAISGAYNVDNTVGHFVGDTGFFVWGNKGAYNVLVCDVHSLNITYRYFNGTYTLLSSAPSDLAQAQRVADGAQGGPFYVAPAIDGTGLLAGNYADAFARKLSQVSLAMTAYAIQPSAVLGVQSVVANIGSRFPLPPFLLLLAISCVYSLLVLAVTLKAIHEVLRAPHEIAIARSRLVDPTTAISTAYGPEEAKYRRSASHGQLFGRETDGDRLSVALQRTDEGSLVVRRAGMGAQLLEADSMEK
ncbi:hypothetical protein C8R46DRAFT_1039002 [Mycena filopes]|nr:hypothetical protein C8R46DRAFT_1039002 [Mycena filopes]